MPQLPWLMRSALIAVLCALTGCAVFAVSQSLRVHCFYACVGALRRCFRLLMRPCFAQSPLHAQVVLPGSAIYELGVDKCLYSLFDAGEWIDCLIGSGFLSFEAVVYGSHCDQAACGPMSPYIWL